jgi:hypothetical protein
MSHSPQVSVVIPTFARPELVSRAVRGVLAQTVRTPPSQIWAILPQVRRGLGDFVLGRRSPSLRVQSS